MRTTSNLLNELRHAARHVPHNYRDDVVAEAALLVLSEAMDILAAVRKADNALRVTERRRSQRLERNAGVVLAKRDTAYNLTEATYNKLQAVQAQIDHAQQVATSRAGFFRRRKEILETAAILKHE